MRSAAKDRPGELRQSKPTGYISDRYTGLCRMALRSCGRLGEEDK